MPPQRPEQVYVVTGAASGIGLATALSLLSQRKCVALTDVNEEKLGNVVASLSHDHVHRVSYFAMDVTVRASVKSLLETTKAQFGHLDGIVHAAGTAGNSLGQLSIWQIDDAEFQSVLDVNVRGSFHVLSEGLTPGLLQEPGASIVLIGSMLSTRGFAKGAAYTASKHAVAGLVRSAALEVGPRGIRVNAVLPGPIDTPMHREHVEKLGPDVSSAFADVPLKRVGAAHEVAEVICFLLSDHSSYVTGALWSVDGGANA